MRDAMNDRNCRVIIVEDEVPALRLLRDMINQIEGLDLIGEARSAGAAMALIDERRPDAVFLDIHLPEGSGLEVLQAVRHRPRVVFTTAYDAHAITAFDLGALDYLLKPFDRRRFEEAAARLLKDWRCGADNQALTRYDIMVGQNRYKTRLFVRRGPKVMSLRVEDIYYIASDGDYAAIHSTKGCDLMATSLTALMNSLDPGQFVRVNRARIVNKQFITGWLALGDRRVKLRLETGTEIIASRSASARLRRLIS